MMTQTEYIKGEIEALQSLQESVEWNITVRTAELNIIKGLAAKKRRELKRFLKWETQKVSRYRLIKRCLLMALAISIILRGKL